MNLIKLQKEIHDQNVLMGWWDEPRPFSTFVCLFHSELSEAMEGDRKGLMDDHLPEYPMAAVELADFVIRCLDWLGSLSVKPNGHVKYSHDGTFTEQLACLHGLVSDAYSVYWEESDTHKRMAAEQITGAIQISETALYRIDPRLSMVKIIKEKTEYNKHRADHKRENRKAEGGKKY